MKSFFYPPGEYEFNVYPKRNLTLVKGENAVVWDDKGKRYIDCVAGHGVANVGHCNPFVMEAIRKQSERLITCSGIFYNDLRDQFLHKLISKTPPGLNRAFLCNSGTEAVETALKFARYSTGRSEFVSAMKGFHGRTFGSMSVTHNPVYRKDFEPGVPGVRFIPFNNIESLRDAITEKTAAVLLEVVQGEGGVWIGDPKFFQTARELCDRFGAILIIDEVQTGFCRTGRWFACEHVGIQPDILCLAKAIAGGLPMGAVVVNDRIKPPMGKHGSTFGGNPLSCSAGMATIDYMERENLAKQAEEKGRFFRKLFEDVHLPIVRDIRQLGLMIGIELKLKVKPVLMQMMEKGVLALPAGPTVLRLLPPLTISLEELEIVAKVVQETLRGLKVTKGRTIASGEPLASAHRST